MIDVKENRFTKYCSEETLSKIVDYETVSHMWQACVGMYAERIAIEDEKQYTYGELDEDIARFRGSLVAAGIETGDFVGIFVPNSYEFIRAYMAVQTLGCTAVLIPVHLSGPELYGCTIKYKMKALVYSEALKERLTDIYTKTPKFPLINANDLSDERVPLRIPKAEDSSTIIFTGGTSGRSKGAVLSHRAVMTGVKNGCYGMEDIFYQRYLLVLPLTHVFGLIRNMLTPLYTGSHTCICGNPKDMFRVMREFNPTVLVLVPALAEMALTLTKQFKKEMWGDSLNYIICGASAVPSHLISEYKEYGVNLFQGYGLTESANLVAGNPENINKPDSVGLPYPGQQLKVVDGELWLKGINMMSGYYDEPEENEAAYTDGWFRTGDLVRFDEDGFMYIVGRKKNVIVLSTGENISPEDVENTFCKFDVIQDAMVYDEVVEGVQILTLEVYPRPLEKAKLENADEYIMTELKKINVSLPSFSRVSKIIIRDEDFERTPAMKKVRKI